MYLFFFQMAKICLAADTIDSSAMPCFPVGAMHCFSTRGRADGHLLLVKYWVGLSTSYKPKSKTRAIPLNGRFCQKLVSRSFSYDPRPAWWNEAVVSEPYCPESSLMISIGFDKRVFRQFSSLFLPSYLSVFVFVSSFPRWSDADVDVFLPLWQTPPSTCLMTTLCPSLHLLRYPSINPSIIGRQE